MRKSLIIIITVLFTNVIASGQNLFLIGEKSYLSTKAITLESNAQYQSDLDVFLAKDGVSGLIAISRQSELWEGFTGKLIIYLVDGNVITCGQSAAREKVDDVAKAVFALTSDQLIKLKTSNIHTVKYSMYRGETENFSASNKGMETHEIISAFFKE